MTTDRAPARAAARTTTRPDGLQDQRRTRADERRALATRPARPASIIEKPCADRPAAEPPAARRRRAPRGYTLIETMIVVAVVAVLAQVALPSFQAQLRRAHRIDALIALVQMQAAQERYRSNAGAFGSQAATGAPSVSPAGHYALQASVTGPDGYELHATAIGSQANDTPCRHLKLSVAGSDLTYLSGSDASVSNAHGANRKCWNL
jgi:type IV pilus assembly protein PilE